MRKAEAEENEREAIQCEQHTFCLCMMVCTNAYRSSGLLPGGWGNILPRESWILHCSMSRRCSRIRCERGVISGLVLVAAGICARRRRLGNSCLGVAQPYWSNALLKRASDVTSSARGVRGAPIIVCGIRGLLDVMHDRVVS